MDVRIEAVDEIAVAQMRHVGPYSEVGPCFERLFQWAASVGGRPGRVITLSHDNPAAVPPEELRSDACIELQTDAAPPQGIKLARIQAGRFAIHTLRGPYEGMAEAYRRLFEEWLPRSGERPDGRPCMEVYRNSPVDTAPADLVTDLCVPLQDLPKA